MRKLDPIDPEKVQALAAAGATDNDIAEFFQRSVATIQRCFAKRLSAGRARRRISIRQAQNKLALVKGNATMLIWLGKNELAQVDRRQPDFPPEPLMDPKVG